MTTLYRVYRKYDPNLTDVMITQETEEYPAIQDADYFMEHTGFTHYVVTVVDGRETDTVYVVSPQ